MFLALVLHLFHMDNDMLYPRCLSVVHQFVQVCQPVTLYFFGADAIVSQRKVHWRGLSLISSTSVAQSFFCFDHHTGTGALFPSSFFVFALSLSTLTTTASTLACQRKRR
jgi:hypothetical protein